MTNTSAFELVHRFSQLRNVNDECIYSRENLNRMNKIRLFPPMIKGVSISLFKMGFSTTNNTFLSFALPTHFIRTDLKLGSHRHSGDEAGMRRERAIDERHFTSGLKDFHLGRHFPSFRSVSVLVIARARTSSVFSELVS